MEYPRVTEILNAFTNYENVPSDILKNAGKRGTAVHALCAGFARGSWIPDSMIDEEYAGYVKSFKQWSEAQISQFLVIEKRYTDEDYHYSGQVDFVAKGTDNELYLIDIKTSAKPQKTFPIQMAAYNNLLKKHDIVVKGAMLVYLSKDGEFPDIHFLENMTEEFHIFQAALDCWNYFNKGKKYGRRKPKSTANS